MSFQTTNDLVLSIASFLAANSKVEEPVDECPICLEVVEVHANRVITECGHIFHCKCLVTNIAHNGFACPYCRTVMAEEIEDDDSEDDYDSGEWYYGPPVESDDDDSVSVAGPGLESHLLRGMRWFFQRVEPQDGDEEFDDTVWETDSEEDEEPPPIMNDDALLEDFDNQIANNLTSSLTSSLNDPEAIDLYDEFTTTLAPTMNASGNDAHVQHMMKLYKDFVASLTNDTTSYSDGFETFIATLSAPYNKEDAV
jgi:hypothetical protein